MACGHLDMACPQRKLGLQRTVLRIIRPSGVESLEVGGRGLDHIGYILRKSPWVRSPKAGLVAVRAGWYKACYLLLISPICRVTCPRRLLHLTS